MKQQLFNSITALQKPTRNSAIDFYRGLAILTVMFFHFNGMLPYGYLGVDLFFVVSGFLIGNMLLREYGSTGKINYFHFLIKRGLKIWPSYYAFLFLGLIIAKYYISTFDPQQYIPPSEWAKYFFYYRNYTGGNPHWIFDHVWSLCVEEHFYTLFPLVIMVINKFWARRFHKIFPWILILGVLMGILAKIVMFFFTKSQDTYAATHNRIDALSLGILLAWLNYKQLVPRTVFFRFFLIIFSLFCMATTLIADTFLASAFYNKVVIHSAIPLCIFLLLLGSIHARINKFFFIRLTGYYTYNLYLWHPMMVIIASHVAGFTFVGFLLYLMLAYAFAILATTLIEEPILAWRDKIFKR